MIFINVRPFWFWHASLPEVYFFPSTNTAVRYLKGLNNTLMLEPLYF